ncbi:MAG: sugar phosphotransferase [Saprospiraceae bacterium]|nr:sugar phosphotransferase [Saprospiraceae bacterium]
MQRDQFGDEQTPPQLAFLSWQNYWHAWGNTQAYALLRAGKAIQRQPFIEAGLNEVRHFYPYLLKKGLLHEFKLVQVGGKLAVHDEKPFPQIAYDLSPMILAATEAQRITGDKAFGETAKQLAAWFSGKNPAWQAMYDPATGRCFDGISSVTELNRNAGAESTIEALLALQALETIERNNLKK